MALTWDESTGQFRNERGLFVSPDSVRRVIDDLADGASERMAALSRQMLSGDVRLAEWQATMMREVKLSQLAASTIANGGAARMGFAQYGAAGREIRNQYGYLARFAAQIADGSQPLDGTVASRAAQYGQAARVTFEREYGRGQRARGYQSERNILAPADHCSLCPALSARGWVPIGSLPPIGTRPCRSNDRCSIQYRRAAAEQAA